MKLRRSFVLAAVSLAAAASVVRADPTPDQLKASYDETVRQLQQSQDRKNQLANENEQLKARVAQLEGKLNAIDAQARQTEFLRSQFVAWSSFLERYPLLLKRFQTMANSNPAVEAVSPPTIFFDPEWPFSIAGRVEEEPASQVMSPPATLMVTVPAVLPTTVPATLPTTEPTTLPASAPALVQMFHGGPNHWCALCAAAAARKAELDRRAPAAEDDLLTPTGADLMKDLPPR